MHDYIIESLKHIDNLNISERLIVWGLGFFKFWAF
jgi:hypothetical protein